MILLVVRSIIRTSNSIEDWTKNYSVQQAIEQKLVSVSNTTYTKDILLAVNELAIIIPVTATLEEATHDDTTLTLIYSGLRHFRTINQTERYWIKIKLDIFSQANIIDLSDLDTLNLDK